MDRPSDEERRRLIKKYESLVEDIARILFRADPIGIAFENPHEDEYAPEASSIARSVPDAKDAADLQRIVHAVFVQYFGADIAGSVSSYAEISRELWALAVSWRAG